MILDVSINIGVSVVLVAGVSNGVKKRRCKSVVPSLDRIKKDGRIEWQQTCEKGGDGAEQIKRVGDRGDQELGQGIKVNREV